MLYELGDVKRLRKQHGLTQSELARLAGVSQSLIAKIEAGIIDPTYTRTRKIFEVLEGLHAGKELQAEQVMTRNIIRLHQRQLVKDAIRKMKEHGISQLPVMEGDSVVGLLSESEIIDRLSQGKDPEKLTVAAVMQEAPPIVAGRTPLHIIMDLLRFSPLVIIADSGKLKGLITKADVIKNLSKA